jgi:hypothetical protein
MRPLLSLAVAAALVRISVAVHPLPPHRLFAIFNGHPEQFAGAATEKKIAELLPVAYATRLNWFR